MYIIYITNSGLNYEIAVIIATECHLSLNGKTINHKAHCYIVVEVLQIRATA